MQTTIRSNEMRGADVMQEELFTLGGLDQYVPVDHPLRRVREVFNGCLLRMDTHFDELYSPFGRESIPPENATIDPCRCAYHCSSASSFSVSCADSCSIISLNQFRIFYNIAIFFYKYICAHRISAQPFASHLYIVPAVH